MVPAFRIGDDLFLDLRGFRTVVPDEWRRATADEVAALFHGSEMAEAINATPQPSPMTLPWLTAVAEEGLEKWPDGTTSRCALNGEAYETFALGYTMGLSTSDVDLIHEFATQIRALKKERDARYISWRKPFEWVTDALNPSHIIAHELTDSPRLINDLRRVLRCRVLITASAEDPDWPNKDWPEVRRSPL